VKAGKAICIYTKVNEIGKSSVKINVEVWSQNTYYDELTKVCDSEFVYVAIDENGRIRRVPEE